jgi:hypothetical protein
VRIHRTIRDRLKRTLKLRVADPGPMMHGTSEDERLQRAGGKRVTVELEKQGGPEQSSALSFQS